MKKLILFSIFLLPLSAAATPDPAAIEAASRDARRALLERGCHPVNDIVLDCPEGQVELDKGRFVFRSSSPIRLQDVWLAFVSECLRAGGKTNQSGNSMECQGGDAFVRASLSDRELVVEVK
jgi:hypothetical protein